MPALKGDDRRATALRAHLHRLQAVQTVRFNALTGGVLVEYDGLVRSREAILRVLDDAGYLLVRQVPPLPAAMGTPRPHSLQGATGAAIKAVIHYVLDLALESAIIAIV